MEKTHYVKNLLTTIFYENGVEESQFDSLPTIESIQYITIIVEIEQTLNIIIPDYFFDYKNISNFEQFLDMVVYEYRVQNDNCESNHIIDKIEDLNS